MVLALSAAWAARSAYARLTTVNQAGTFLLFPRPVLALLSVRGMCRERWRSALIVFPRVYAMRITFWRRPIAASHHYGAGQRAERAANFFWHVVPVAGPQLLAVAGVSAEHRPGAAIPSGSALWTGGVGQLAWQAALARDLPLLTNLTIPGDAGNLAGQPRVPM